MAKSFSRINIILKNNVVSNEIPPSFSARAVTIYMKMWTSKDEEIVVQADVFLYESPELIMAYVLWILVI